MSLRRTAFLWFAGLMAVVGILAAATSYWLVRGEAAVFLDSQLRQVALYVGDAPDSPALPNVVEHDPEDDFLIQVWDATGHTLRNSDPAIGVERRGRTGFMTVSDSGEDWRVFTLVTPLRTVQVSQRIQVRQELATEAALRAALPIALLIPLTWLVLSWIIDRIMVRLNRIAVAVSHRDPLDAQPIPVEGVPAEILPFVQSINQLIQRLRALIERQRRFVSDAAHELRSPLSALQIQIGNLRTANRDPRLEDLLADMDAGVHRSSGLVGQLLRLARYDADAVKPTDGQIDLTAITLACMAQIAPLAEQKSIDLGIVRKDMAQCLGHAADFGVIIGNLIDNAVRHTPVGGAVDVAVIRDGEAVTVEVADNGGGIAPENMPRIFERFFRAAPQETEGSGLGLAIAKAAAERNRATITVENRTDGPGLLTRVRVAAR